MQAYLPIHVCNVFVVGPVKLNVKALLRSTWPFSWLSCKIDATATLKA